MLRAGLRYGPGPDFSSRPRQIFCLIFPASRRRRGEKVTVDVQVTVSGESYPGTIHVFEAQTLSLEVEATHIPNEVVVSIEGLTGGTSITAGEITLPEGASLLSDPDLTVIAISVPPASADDLAAEAAASEIAASQSAASAAAAEV